jgi:hypothetical protein
VKKVWKKHMLLQLHHYWCFFYKNIRVFLVLFLTFQLGSMTKILECKPKWMMLSLQLLKAKGQCDKFSVVEVDGMSWLSIFVSPSVWL